MPSAFIALALALWMAASTACAADASGADDISVRACTRVMVERSMALSRGDQVTPTTRQRACLDYLMAEQERPRAQIELQNLSTDTRFAQCLRAFFSLASDGTEYELRYEGKGCGALLKCAIQLTLSATDGLHDEQREVYPSGLIEMVMHQSGRWLALQQGRFACSVAESSTAQ